jgi:hypothetical protein
MDGEIALFDHHTGPHGLQQLFLADHAVSVRQQAHQQVECARAHGNRLAIDQQPALVRTNLDAVRAG